MAEPRNYFAGGQHKFTNSGGYFNPLILNLHLFALATYGQKPVEVSLDLIPQRQERSVVVR